MHTADGTIGVDRPEVIRIAEVTTARKLELSIQWLQYYVAALQHLSQVTTLGTLDPSVALSYKLWYSAEYAKYIQLQQQLLDIPSSSAGASVAGGAAAAGTTGTSVSVPPKLKLGTFDRGTNPDVFFDKFRTYCTHNGITDVPEIRQQC